MTEIINHPGSAESRPGGWPPRRVAFVARVVFIIGAVLAFAYFARAVLIPVVLACVLAVTLAAPMRLLRRCHLPAPLAAAIVVALLVTLAGLSVNYLARPALEWVAKAPDNLPHLQHKFRNLLRPAARLSEAASSVGKLADAEPARPAQPVEVKNNQVANTVFSWTGSLLAGATETAALLFLLLAGGDVFQQKLVRAMPRLRDKKQVLEISREIQQSVSTYLFSVGLINLGFGVVAALALQLMGMPNAVMWGGVAAFANFVPYVGPILGMVSIGLAGLLAFDTLGQGLLPAGIYALLHLIESWAITPYVLGRRFALNPVVIFVTLIFFAWLWGVIGALLAIPLLVTLKVVCDHLPSLQLLGEFLAPHPPTPPEADPCPNAAAGAVAGPAAHRPS